MTLRNTLIMASLATLLLMSFVPTASAEDPVQLVKDTMHENNPINYCSDNIMAVCLISHGYFAEGCEVLESDLGVRTGLCQRL